MSIESTPTKISLMGIIPYFTLLGAVNIRDQGSLLKGW